MLISQMEYNSIKNKQSFNIEDLEKLNEYKYINNNDIEILIILYLKYYGFVIEEKMYIIKYNNMYFCKIHNVNNTYYYRFNSLSEYNNWINKKYTNRCKNCNK